MRDNLKTIIIDSQNIKRELRGLLKNKELSRSVHEALLRIVEHNTQIQLLARAAIPRV